MGKVWNGEIIGIRFLCSKRVLKLIFFNRLSFTIKEGPKMSAKRIIILMIVLFLTFVSVWHCAKKERIDTIKIGVSLPLTGDAAVWGKGQKYGYELALDQINNKGGVNGKKIKLVYGDDQGLPKTGVSVLQKLIGVEKIKLLTGVANSSVALAYIPIINQEKILFISSGASSPKLTGVSKYFFRTWPSDNAEALAMAKYAFNELQVKRLSILYINNDYGIGLKNPLIKLFTKLGGEIVIIDSFEQGATDFRTQLSKIVAVKQDAIYLAGNPREMGRCIKQARELGIITQFLSISTLNDPEVFGITGQKAIEGTIISDASFDPDSPNPLTQSFLKDFKGMFNKEPGILAITAYDALNVLVHAIEKVGERPEAIADFLHNLKNYNGASGSLSFTPGGDVNRPIRISKAENGSFIPIERDYQWF